MSTTDVPESADPKAGDLAFYAPWGNLAIYHRDAPPAGGVVAETMSPGPSLSCGPSPRS